MLSSFFLSLFAFCLLYLLSLQAYAVRTMAFVASLLPMWAVCSLWWGFDASGHGLQYLVILGRSHLAFGIDAVALSLMMLTVILFPICMMLLRSVAGFMTFILLEVLVLLAVCVLDLLGFYILFEASLILLFLLIGRAPYGSFEAAYKIVLYTMAGSLVLLPTLFMIYSECGTTNVLYMSCACHHQTVLGWGLLAVLAVKIPLMPVHLWLPEAHVAAPTAGSVLLAGILLKLGGLGFLRFMLPVVTEFCVLVFPILTTLCLVSFLFSTLSTLRLIDLKKIVAYSSIAHMSMVTLAIFSQSEFSAYSSSYLMVAHGLVSPSLFLIVGVLYDRAHTKFILYFSGLGASMPIGSFLFFFFTLGNLAFPLFPNFIAEILCLVSIFAVHELLAYVFCICQVLGAAYGFWAFNRVVHGRPTGNADLSRTELFTIVPLATVSLISGLGAFQPSSALLSDQSAGDLPSDTDEPVAATLPPVVDSTVSSLASVDPSESVLAAPQLPEVPAESEMEQSVIESDNAQPVDKPSSYPGMSQAESDAIWAGLLSLYRQYEADIAAEATSEAPYTLRSVLDVPGNHDFSGYMGTVLERRIQLAVCQDIRDAKNGNFPFPPVLSLRHAAFQRLTLNFLVELGPEYSNPGVFAVFPSDRSGMIVDYAFDVAKRLGEYAVQDCLTQLPSPSFVMVLALIPEGSQCLTADGLIDLWAFPTDGGKPYLNSNGRTWLKARVNFLKAGEYPQSVLEALPHPAQDRI